MKKENVHESPERGHQNDFAQERVETLTGYLAMLKNRKTLLELQSSRIRTIKTFFIRPEIRETEEQLKRWKETLEKNSVGGGIDRKGLNSTGGSPF